MVDDASPEYWRSRAKIVRNMIAKTRDVRILEDLQEIARCYERLVRIAEQRYGRKAAPKAE